MTIQPSETILIIDFGSQLTQLIARRVREAGVYGEILPFSATDEAFVALRPKGIILSGGPASVLKENSPQVAKSLFEMAVPILAICYGQQTLCLQLGGQIESGQGAEFGRADVQIHKASPLFEGVWEIGGKYPVWMSHGDRVTVAPLGFEVIATSPQAPFAVCVDEKRRYYTSMFHPEVAHTPDGAGLLSNFVHRICGCSGDWTMTEFRTAKIADIRAQVGSGRVICGLSGGVDSMVAAVLIHEAIGEQLTCILVDHGLLRKNERAQVKQLFTDHYTATLIVVDAEKRFMEGLARITDPEEKRKFIGREFIAVFEEEAHKIGGADFLAQGTLYPDVIESRSVTGAPGVTIKSHHNVGGLPEQMAMELVEPLRELFKDEVRLLGKELSLPEAFVKRHPFPGPGLAIRILGEVTPERRDIVRAVDAIYLEEIRNAGLYDAIWQAFAVLLPVRSVGVMGDARTYDNVCALRAVTSVDGMTADIYPFEAAFLSRCATRIINEVKGVNRVVYDYTSKPPGTIEWE